MALLHAGVVIGAIVGYLEVLLAFGTGRMLVGDAAWFFGFQLIFWVAAGLALAAVVALVERLTRTRPLVSRHHWVSALFVAPVTLFCARMISHGEHAVGWPLLLAAALALCAALTYSIERLRTWVGSAVGRPARLLALVLAAYGLAVFAFVIATLDLRDLLASVGWTRATGTVSAYLAYAAVVVMTVERMRVDSIANAKSALACLAVSALFAAAVGISIGMPMERWTGDVRGEAGPSTPNILLITVDTARADHFSSYGYHRQTTPYLDAFSQKAFLFEAAYASSPYTLSSHASLFTGLLPHAHGAHPI
ncbi:MAG: sulfatase-like hydrolase/transferase, partial [Candidatus Binatia bacterium]